MSTVTPAKKYTVTVHVAGPQRRSDNQISQAGHMWYSLSDGTGEAKSYGFGPKKPGDPFGPGKITDQDNVLYPDKYSREISITKAQYEAMRKFGENPAAGGFDISNYNIFSNSCVDFTWKALEKVGLNPREYQGDVLPSLNKGEVERIGKTGFAAPADNFLDFLKQIVWQINGYYTRASRLFPHQDPLALDLDGDGIETRGADGTVLFDHNGDGIRTGTGWVRSDDGLLVLDRNSNGTIDTGAELFGVHTVKADGTQASDGFDAQSDLGNGNTQTASATFTRSDGTLRQTNNATGCAAHRLGRHFHAANHSRPGHGQWVYPDLYGARPVDMGLSE